MEATQPQERKAVQLYVSLASKHLEHFFRDDVEQEESKKQHIVDVDLFLLEL